MNRLKFVLGVSLIANIALMVWAFRQRATIQEIYRDADEGLELLNHMESNLHQIEQDLTSQNSRTIASNDQLGAFIEEHAKYIG